MTGAVLHGDADPALALADLHRCRSLSVPVGMPCDRGVRGKARGCWDHGRWKRDAMFAVIGRRNPGQRFRVMWSAPGVSPIPVHTGRAREMESQAANASRGAYNLVMLIATVVSAIAAVAALAPR